jgi:hypothetical protein
VDAEEVFEAVREILDSIDKMTLQVVFLAWMDRPKKCIQANGESTE